MSPAGAESVERVVLRAAVGDKNYTHVEHVAMLLDALAAGGVLTDEGVTNVIAVLADEIIVASVARQVANDLSTRAPVADTSTPEDPNT